MNAAAILPNVYVKMANHAIVSPILVSFSPLFLLSIGRPFSRHFKRKLLRPRFEQTTQTQFVYYTLDVMQHCATTAARLQLDFRCQFASLQALRTFSLPVILV
jgi:hypothetical protein